MTLLEFIDKHVIVSLAFVVIFISLVGGLTTAVIGSFIGDPALVEGGVSVAGILPGVILFGLGMGWALEQI